jgi:hypothetical protein
MNGRLITARWVLRCLILFASASALIWIVGCGDSDGNVSAEDIERAQTAIGSLKKELQTALREGLREGPENAIEVCQIKAPGISKRLTGDGITVGRTSHRLRNPENAPEPWVEPLLDEYASAVGEGTWRAVRLDDGSVGYVEPIYVRPVCLKCHGGDLSEAVAGRINTLYPHDEATGFESGDFRGLFWVRIDAGASDG